MLHAGQDWRYASKITQVVTRTAERRISQPFRASEAAASSGAYLETTKQPQGPDPSPASQIAVHGTAPPPTHVMVTYHI